jgi:hypothetical protein
MELTTEEWGQCGASITPSIQAKIEDRQRRLEERRKEIEERNAYVEQLAKKPPSEPTRGHLIKPNNPAKMLPFVMALMLGIIGIACISQANAQPTPTFISQMR